jgi:DNA-binding transcriptional LysR family regulator
LSDETYKLVLLVKVELRHLRYFIALAEELHFQRAAERVYLSQPALSQQIQRLEETLGFLLFERTKRKVTLTRGGEAFLRVARRTLTTFERGMEEVKKVTGSVSQQLRVGLTDYDNYTLVPTVLNMFRESFPKVEVIEQEMGTLAQIQALREKTLDVGLFLKTFSDPSLIFETLVTKELSLALPKTHPLGRFVTIPFKALADERLLLFSRELSSGYYDLVDECCKIAGITPQFVINHGPRIYSFNTLARLIVTGEGVAILVNWYADANHPNLIFRPLIEPTPKLDFVVAYRPDDVSTPVAEFVRLLKTTQPFT